MAGHRWLQRRNIMVGLIAGLPAILLMLLPLAAGSDGQQTEGLHYIALGDSIPSGNVYPTDESRPCQRGAESYAVIAGQRLAQAYDRAEFTFSHVACSGARIAVGEEDVLDRCLDELDRNASDEQVDACQLKWLPHQVDEALDRIDGRETLVTITVGANDTGWTDPLGLIALMLATDDEFRDAIDDVAEDVGDALETAIGRLTDDPDVTVIVTDIYNPFNAESVLFDLARAAQGTAWGITNVGDEPCTGTDRNGVEHTLSCAERAEYGLQALSAAIQSAVAEHSRQASFVSLIEPFRGYEAPEGFCGDAEPAAGETFIRETASGALVPFPDCFHPNALGAEAIAGLVLEAWETTP